MLKWVQVGFTSPYDFSSVYSILQCASKLISLAMSDVNPAPPAKTWPKFCETWFMVGIVFNICAWTFFWCPFCAVIGNLGNSLHLYISLYFLAQERGTCVEEMEEPTWDSTRRMWGDLHALGSEGWCCFHSPFLFPSLAVCRNDVCYFFGCLPCSAPPPSLSMQDAQKQPAQLALCLLEHGEAWWNHSHK